MLPGRTKCVSAPAAAATAPHLGDALTHSLFVAHFAQLLLGHCGDAPPARRGPRNLAVHLSIAAGRARGAGIRGARLGIHIASAATAGIAGGTGSHRLQLQLAPWSAASGSLQLLGQHAHSARHRRGFHTYWVEWCAEAAPIGWRGCGGGAAASAHSASLEHIDSPSVAVNQTIYSSALPADLYSSMCSIQGIVRCSDHHTKIRISNKL